MSSSILLQGWGRARGPAAAATLRTTRGPLADRRYNARRGAPPPLARDSFGAAMWCEVGGLPSTPHSEANCSSDDAQAK